MSKLTEFYNIKSQVFDTNVDSSRWDAVEEKLIREELLPELMDLLKPVLSQVKSPLALNISYDPNGNLAINVTRNCIQSVEKMNVVSKDKDKNIVEHDECSPSIVSEPEAKEDTIQNEEETAPTEQKELVVRKKSKSVGFSVSFGDGTIIREKKAVKTWIKTLQKIGLDNIINNQRKHDAWHTVGGKNICIVDRVETVRSSDNASPQTFIDGYYVMTQLSNSQKVKDIEALAELWPKLKMKVIWNNVKGVESKSPKLITEINENL